MLRAKLRFACGKWETSQAHPQKPTRPVNLHAGINLCVNYFQLDCSTFFLWHYWLDMEPVGTESR